MRLTLAIALILVELGAGVLLALPLVPIREVRKSFFTFHSMLSAVCFALAAGVYQFELHAPTPASGLLCAMLVCIVSFATAQFEKGRLTRLCHGAAAVVGIVFGLVLPIHSLAGWLNASQGSPVVSFLLLGCWIGGALLGASLLGNTHDAMALGHWYLISRHLSFAYLIRITKVLMALLVLRAVFLVFVLVALPHLAPPYSQAYVPQLFSAGGNLVFFMMRVLWGLVLPLILAAMSWRCSVGKANQAATGLLYLCEVSVLFGELFAAYLMV